MSSSPIRRTVAWTVPAALVASSLAVAATSASAAPTTPNAAPAVKAQAVGGGETIVGLGDSYMSGEGVMISNHNFEKADPSCDASNWQLAAGSVGNGSACVVTASYMYDAKAAGSSWTITPSTSTSNGARTFRSVFGDANGWPDSVPATNPQGIESTPYCDRSFAAEPIIGNGWTTKNFACSGATQPNAIGTDKAYKGIALSQPEFNYAKPGVSFETVKVPDPFPQGFGEVPGQAASLQQYAEQNDKITVVALSIGGNDFGFGAIGKSCITDGALGGRCETKQATKDKVTEGAKKARAAVTTAIENVTKAMHDAGYADGSWKLVYQDPPLPVTKGLDTKWEWSDSALGFGGTRGTVGGCGLADSTLDWVVDDVYPTLTDALAEGVMDARDALGHTPVVRIKTKKTFEGHRLCEKGTQGASPYATKQAGRTPPWQDNNGKDTEWVTYISKSAATLGNTYQASMPLHPNYWGQRALSACIAGAVDQEGSVAVDCVQDPAGDLNAQGQPRMDIQDARILWIDVTGQPVIQGIPNPGQTLTADSHGVFQPAADYAYYYQWYADGVAIDGATAKTFGVSAGDVGKDLTVRVSVSAQGRTAESTSDAVSVSDLTVVTAPAISGQAKVDETLSVSSGTYSASPDTIQYQWMADGEDIPGATGTTYAVVAADAGKRISVRVTVSKASFQDLTLNTDETAEVAVGTLTVTGKPTIAGQLLAGQILTADTAGVTYSHTPDRIAFRWYRNGDLIEGVEGSTYELTGDDVGANITVKVEAFRDGYTDAASELSSAVGPVGKGAIKKIGTPTLRYGSSTGVNPLKVKKHKLKYGNSIEADIWNVFSEWPAPADVTWYRKAKGKTSQIKKANDDFYWQPSVKDIGSRVRVKIATANEGFEQASATTAWYTIVKGTYKSLKAPKIKGKAKVGQRLATTKARFLPRGGDVRYQWYANGTKIKGATGRVYRAEPSVKGTKLRIKAYIRETKGYEAASVWSEKVGPVRAVKGLG